MTEAKPAPQPIFRKDYRRPDYTIDRVDLRFELGEDVTRVHATLTVRRMDGTPEGAPLVLDGENLAHVSVALDGRELSAGEYFVTPTSLTIPAPGAGFTLATVVEIKPQDNLELSGLYRSSGNFCTQCEAEGFRRITWFLDRPDVMARYSVVVEADKAKYPVLLANGNRVATGDLDGGRHFARWDDPFPKPSYLFALVAGDLRCFPGEFLTRSGRTVRLEIWVEPDNIDRCAHALRSLQAAMRWDEEKFGREYDLDIYMIVAVSDFNMGAMENKGLNLFNAKYVLARPDTATDDDYDGIESVIAHEYFHNWTGNRVTCRDWFQLTLKEGLTVFRDRLFSADMGSPAVARIGDVLALRTNQFAEDSGPMAHPIRPESYIEMNNFYTTTVYEKGAEVIGMMRTLLGEAGFRRGMDLYFERHDGQAVTCDDFRAALADANGVDLEQFGRWYSQVGTPVVRARGEYDADARSYTLTLEQAPPRGRTSAELLHIPVAVGLVGPDGPLSFKLSGETAASADTRVLELRERSQSFRFDDVAAAPVVSLLRGFSAPVELEVERSDADLARLMAADPDSFSRWDAGQELGRRVLLRLAADVEARRPLALDPAFVAACAEIVADPGLDGSLKALALTLPNERLLGQHQPVVAVDALHEAREFAFKALAAALREPLLAIYQSTAPQGQYRIERAEVDRRKLRNLALAYLVALGEPELVALAMSQFHLADNMTDSEAALACLIEHGGPERDAALAEFHRRWHKDPLVLDKWFALQAASGHPDTLERVTALADHPDFNLLNPNRARSLVGVFGMRNQHQFHRKDGRGHALVADKVLAIDAHNSQLAARLVAAFNPWRRFDATRQQSMRTQLERIAGHSGLSKAVREIVDRALAPA
ncbi:aminopeptidase N [Nannocystis exedens]|uniref:Aminopeptidase N n=1 Tax=Nannocystis exedens TaxID=54 RepID=A0A1I2GTL7_9BACT|nr:aminopeptidase N [Nannocystis exedens]PCC74095.1 aminopeptidase N [Nannocystis exedens]SFF20812.1 aminopeptidase N [Nannocystis exedens]